MHVLVTTYVAEFKFLIHLCIVCCLSFLPLPKFKPHRFCSLCGSFALSFEDVGGMLINQM